MKPKIMVERLSQMPTLYHRNTEMFENTEQGFCFNFYSISGTLEKSV